MKTLHLNCASGISGDMFAGALLDLGISAEYLQEQLSKLHFHEFSTSVRSVDKNGVKATKFDVDAKEQQAHRHLSDINKIIDESKLSDAVKSLAKKIFLNLGRAEATVHEATLESVHFHEVGAVDSIVDIVAAAILVDKLGIERITCSPISVGRGTTICAHGVMKLPVPATAELLRFANAPSTVLSIPKELTTPTGAAIATTLAEEFCVDPSMDNVQKGFGAGTRDLEQQPNVLEVWLGETAATDSKIMLSTQIDDMNPELFEYVISRLMEAGAADAFIQPVVMKKSRIGALLTVLCTAQTKEALLGIIFTETTTFGIRVGTTGRVMLDRAMESVDTPFGVIPVKVGSYKGKRKTVSPEYEACKQAAQKHGVPIGDVYDAAKEGYKN